MVDTTTDANINSKAFSIQTAVSAKRAVVTELPMIDISPFLTDSTISERRRCDTHSPPGEVHHFPALASFSP